MTLGPQTALNAPFQAVFLHSWLCVVSQTGELINMVISGTKASQSSCSDLLFTRGSQSQERWLKEHDEYTKTGPSKNIKVGKSIIINV